MGRRTIEEVQDGTETLEEVRDVLGDPQGGLERVVDHLGRFGTGRKTLEEVWEGWWTLGEVMDGSGDPLEDCNGTGDNPEGP